MRGKGIHSLPLANRAMSHILFSGEEEGHSIGFIPLDRELLKR